MSARDDQVVPPLDQQQEEVHRVTLEANRAVVTAKLVGRDVELEITEAEGVAGI